jgi:cysteine desulfurase family protein (TIGR01976 family)
MPLDLEFVRAQFPAFSEPSLQRFAHFENAGGSFACGQVISALQRFYTQTKVQPYYGFEPSKTAGQQMDRARSRFAAWLNVGADEVHFGPSTSQNTFNLAQALRTHLRPGDEVIVTNQDHEANIGAWRRLAEAGMVVREWRVDPGSAELETSGLERLLNARTRVVAFTHCSNLVGSINPVREWCELARADGAMTIVDGVSYAPHGLPDLQALGADVYLFSLYKVYGPHQGAMVLRREWNERLPNQGHFFNADKAAYRFTPAGPDHAQVAAVNGVMDYFEAVYAHHFPQAAAEPVEQARAVHELFRSAECARVQPLLDGLADRPGVRLVGRRDASERAPTVSITVKGRAPREIAAALAGEGIGIGNGNCYAYRLVEALGLPPEEGVARMSLVHYTSEQEVTRLLDALDRLL